MTRLLNTAMIGTLTEIGRLLVDRSAGRRVAVIDPQDAALLRLGRLRVARCCGCEKCYRQRDKFCSHRILPGRMAAGQTSPAADSWLF